MFTLEARRRSTVSSSLDGLRGSEELKRQMRNCRETVKLPDVCGLNTIERLKYERRFNIPIADNGLTALEGVVNLRLNVIVPIRGDQASQCSAAEMLLRLPTKLAK
jgi:hypothetical protein